MTQPVLLSWSGGKDSTMALDALRDDPQVEVVALLTTVAEDSRRLAMHGVRDDLIAAQAAAIGLPVDFVALPTSPPNEVYEQRMAVALGRWHERGVTAVAHGDLFLEDIREYREAMLGSTGYDGPVFDHPVAFQQGEDVDRDGFAYRDLLPA